MHGMAYKPEGFSLLQIKKRSEGDHKHWNADRWSGRVWGRGSYSALWPYWGRGKFFGECI